MNRLWVRLSLAFVFVAVISALAVAVLATSVAGNQFQQYIARRDALAQSGLLDSLAAYYQATGTWNGVEVVLTQSSGRGQGRGRPPLLRATSSTMSAINAQALHCAPANETARCPSL
jgi:hypothetical protein